MSASSADERTLELIVTERTPGVCVSRSRSPKLILDI